MQNIFKIHIPKERRKKVYEQIEENCHNDFGFYFMMIAASVIVALGLFINNTAVVIGGMLLAPLFNHLLGISISVVRGNIKKFYFHLATLFKAIVLAILVTYFVFLILPNDQKTSYEILSRGEADILNFWIAVFSGVAAATAMALPKISESIIGVLVASAIVPPLATISYGLSSGNINLIGGAFLLFITNFVTIVFFATIAFYFYGFRPPKTKVAKELIKKDIYWSIILIILILIPLSYSFIKADQEQYNERKAIQIIQDNIAGLEKKDISDIYITKKNNIYNVRLTIYTDQEISKEIKTKLESEFAKSFNAQANIELTVIETIKIR